MKDKPLIVILDEARKMTIQSINDILAKTKLPAFLMEGIVMEVLSDIRKLKNIELENAIKEMTEQPENPKE